jgi:aldose 1-epimerase
MARDPAEIGGAPVLELTALDAPPQGPALLQASVLPGRGMMLLQARLRLASGEVVDALHAPPTAAAAQALSGGPDDFNGNAAFSFGDALLAPFANRITGRPLADRREIEVSLRGQSVRLPRNWGGREPGAVQYAMHGLILDSHVAWAQPSADCVTGRLEAGDFGVGWPSRCTLSFEWRLMGGGLRLRVQASNVGDEPLPIGLGSHPYFALPSGDRRQARLRLDAEQRTEVNNYDEVLPTGRLLPTRGGAYDFSGPVGRALDGLYLDDCFTGLERRQGEVVVEILDPAADLGLRISSPSPGVKAVQVYAPRDQAFVVVEPQFNLADPCSDVWPRSLDTGLAWVAPGEHAAYEVRIDPFQMGNRLIP